MDPGKKGMEPAVWVAVPPPPRTSGPQRPDHASGSAAEPQTMRRDPVGVKTSDGCQRVQLPWETETQTPNTLGHLA